MKKCPFCAEEIQDEAIKCRYCLSDLSPVKVAKDVKLQQNKLEPKVIRIEVSKMTQKPSPRPSPQQSKVATLPIEETKENERLYEAVIGEKNSTYYFTKFLEFDQLPPGLKASWNWAAFFFGWGWALYRKMYGWFFALLGIWFMSIIFETAHFPVWGFFLLVVPWTAFVIFANSLYKNDIRKKIAIAQYTIKDETKVLEYLLYKGGVNIWVIWVSACICVLGLLSFVVTLDAGLFSQEVNYGALPIFAALIIGVLAIGAILYMLFNKEKSGVDPIDWETKLAKILEKPCLHELLKMPSRLFIVLLIIICIITAGIIAIYQREEPAPAEASKVEAPIASPALSPSEDSFKKAKTLFSGWECSDPPKAIKYLNEVVRQEPNNYDAYIYRGFAYANLDQHQRAIEDWTQAIRLKPNYYAYYNRGVAYARLSQYQRSMEDYTEAIRLKPYDADAYHGRGFAYLSQSNKKQGCQDLKKACELGKCKTLETFKDKGYCR